MQLNSNDIIYICITLNFTNAIEQVNGLITLWSYSI